MGDKSQKTLVYRITVDEKLSDDLFRFAFCLLKQGIEMFTDRVDDWDDEHSVLVSSRTHYRTFHVKKSEAPEWGTLQEGQVYLCGGFEPVPDEKEPDHFNVSSDKRRVLRIDKLKIIDDGIKALYSDALRRS